MKLFGRVSQASASTALGVIVLASAALVAVPSVSFEDPFASVLFDRDGDLLAARVAADGQWRFPAIRAVPDRIATAIVAFEDKRFFAHPGIDPLALGRAFFQNVKAARVVSGASTLTMQVARLSRERPARTMWNKAYEGLMALKLEFLRSKAEILAMYASHAPFGGNVVGVEAASWRYFGRPPNSVSWAEASLLAVMPNAPSLLHLGRSRPALKAKRDRLLRRLRAGGAISETTLVLSLQEPLPKRPHPLPQRGMHLLHHATHWRGPSRFESSLDGTFQQRVSAALLRHHGRWRGNGVHNAAALVFDITTGEVLAYVGNHPGSEGHHNNMVTARRSTGSVLKPALYAAAIDAGVLFPEELLTDIPTRFGGFAPENFSQGYDGAVSARVALARSLNVPAVRLLERYGVTQFQQDLEDLGLTTLHRTPDEYGLSLIVGGAEGTLWELTSLFARMARAVSGKGFHPHYLSESARPTATTPAENAPSPASLYVTMQALADVVRPGAQEAWYRWSSGTRIAWKTGTSFGFRDAWSIGVTSKYAVGIWVGNASGEGRPRLTGMTAAAPLLFEIFGMLPPSDWFDRPSDGWADVLLCAHSGHLAGPECPSQRVRVPQSLERGSVCPYCTRIHTSRDGRYRLHAGCAELQDLVATPWFVLPPAQEFFYRRAHAGYRPPPPLRNDCRRDEPVSQVSVLYPKEGSSLYVPLELDGKVGRAVFQATHRDPAEELHWHLDEHYLGATRVFHQMEVNPRPGEHLLTVVDPQGASVRRRFKVLRK